jgi:ATP-dependent HslUV protease ATP-binding subunit HslU
MTEWWKSTSERGPAIEFAGNVGLEEMDFNLKDFIPALMAGRSRKRKMRVSEALDYLIQEEEQSSWTWIR